MTGVTAPRAIAFRAAADARYRRTGVSWIPPAAAILRVPLHPVHVENRVYIDARSLRIVAAAAERQAIATRRIERAAAPVHARLVERSRRDDARNLETSLTHIEQATERVVRRTSAEAQPIPPVAMVLARTPESVEHVKPTAASADASDWGSPLRAPVRQAAKTSADGAPALSQAEVNHLTERVVAVIDRRMLAARERLGL